MTFQVGSLTQVADFDAIQTALCAWMASSLHLVQANVIGVRINSGNPERQALS